MAEGGELPADENVCAFCGCRCKPGDGRAVADGAWLCRGHRPCPCGRPDCDTDARRVAAGQDGAFFAIESSFVADETGHLLYLPDRPCAQCGEKCMHVQDPENPRPRTQGGTYCYACRKCAHGSDAGLTVRYDMNEPRTERDPPAQQMYTARVHTACMVCKTCGARGEDYVPYPQHIDALNDWSLTPVGVVHLPCEPCAICGNVGRKGQKRKIVSCEDPQYVGAVCSVHVACYGRRTKAERTARKARRELAPLPVPWLFQK